MAKMQKLTERQRMVLDFITKTIRDKGYPPTLREIGQHMGIRSTNGVNDHLKALERKGYLRKSGLRARALTPLVDIATIDKSNDLVEVPLLGKVAAGQPIPRIENATERLKVDPLFLGNHRNVFALQITGDSMINDGILEGDVVFVRSQNQAENGEVVVANIDDEVTLKRFYREGRRVRFQPANDQMEPITIRKSDLKPTQILGVLVGLYRKY